MNRSMLMLGSIFSLVIVGGTIVYGGQDAAASPHSTNGMVLTKGIFSQADPADATATSSIATTGIASGMTSSTATLHAVVYPHGAEISYWFEYSSDPFLWQVLNRKTSRVLLITDSDQTLIEADISGLSSSTKYYFRVVADIGAGPVRGDRVSFNTK